jgi:hypothetical protein
VPDAPVPAPHAAVVAAPAPVPAPAQNWKAWVEIPVRGPAPAQPVAAIRDLEAPLALYFDASLRDEPLDASEEFGVDAWADAYLSTGSSIPPAAYQVWTGSPDEPSFKQAMAGPNQGEWNIAIASELEMLRDLRAWDPSPAMIPPGKRAISSKWVLLRKRNEDGVIVKYKARLVARGDQQREGDFGETFSPTCKLASVRMVIALAAAQDWPLEQIDCVGAFLNGSVSEELYVRLPDGSQHRLLRSLYGLKQSGYEWNKVLDVALVELGFVRQEHDRGLYINNFGGKSIYVLLHVDDGIITGDGDIAGFIRALGAKFKITHLGEARLFLNILIRRNREQRIVTLDQRHQVSSILANHGMTDCTPVATPVETKPADLDNPGVEMSTVPYRQAIGELLYLAGCTRPDISFAVHRQARFASDPSWKDWIAVKRIFRYLKGTPNLGLRYGRSAAGTTLEVFVDADHAACQTSRTSVTGFVNILYGGSISWSSTRQLSVAVSTTEAEYMAMSAATREVVWLRSLLKVVGFAQDGPTRIYGDNQGCIALASHPTLHQKTKHIAVHYHYTRQKIAEGDIVAEWIPTARMVADVLTKGLPAKQHYLFVEGLGLRDVILEGESWSRGTQGSEKDKGETVLCVLWDSRETGV